MSLYVLVSKYYCINLVFIKFSFLSCTHNDTYICYSYKESKKLSYFKFININKLIKSIQEYCLLFILI